MTVDPLYILLLVEAVIILAAVLIFMFLRPKAEPSPAVLPEPPPEPAPDSDVIRRALFLRMLKDNIKEIEQRAGLGQKGDESESQEFLLDQIYDLNLDLLRNLEAGLRREEVNPIESLAETLTVKFRVSVNDRLLSFMRSLEKQPAPTPEGKNEDPPP